VISHKHKFIYTKVAKAGSSSIQKAFLRYDKEDTHNLGHYHLLDDIDDKTKDYFKFTFVRNPWARCVSLYFYKRQVKGHDVYRNADFKEFVMSDDRKFSLLHLSDWCLHSPNLHRIWTELNPFENQIDWISDEYGNVLADFVGKVENFQEDLNTVCDKIGIPHQKILHVNRSEHKHYTEYYDNETIQVVAERFKKDIEHFGYKFGGYE
jgi:hypothetical protein